MTPKTFDLHSIRRNWERSAATLPVRSPDRLGFVQAPLDVYVAGAQLLERLRQELCDAFPAQQAALAPFLRRAESGFEQLRTRAQDGEADAAELGALREQLTAALSDLEDICEAFLGLSR
ncbi:MAG TPA: hypothetical protein VG963_06810 [Polyangiaceae bacterium]|nr:hypothetical protein [Polyangiaceae bacterium]